MYEDFLFLVQNRGQTGIAKKTGKPSMYMKAHKAKKESLRKRQSAPNCALTRPLAALS